MSGGGGSERGVKDLVIDRIAKRMTSGLIQGAVNKLSIQ